MTCRFYKNTHDSQQVYFISPHPMPVIYTPKILRSKQVPNTRILYASVQLIQETLEVMADEGEIIGASSYGSLFHKSANITCASDIDWLVVFSSTTHMLHSAHWRTLLAELSNRHIHFQVPALSVDHIKSGNHTLSSLLHGVRYSERRLITKHDPIDIFAQHGWRQNSVLTTLQLLSSFTRFFFEAYAYDFNSYHQAQKYDLLSQAVSIWKDIISSMVVACIPSDMTVEASWQKYALMYSLTFPAAVLENGRRVYYFLEDLRRRMKQYEHIIGSDKHEIALEEFCSDHAAFLEAAEDIIPAAAEFAEANISLYRQWALTQGVEQLKSETSQQKHHVHSTSSFTPILYGVTTSSRIHHIA